MRKLMAILIMLIAAAFTLAAESYSVKFKNEFGITETTCYTIDSDEKNYEGSYTVLFAAKVCGNKIMVIDEDSELYEIAITNKLDKQGYKAAHTDFQFGNIKFKTYYYKINGIWYAIR